MPTSPSPFDRLHRLPLDSKSSNSHQWVDYVELLCLVNTDREISKADVLDRVSERKDLGELDEDWNDNSDFLPDEYEDSNDDLDFILGEYKQPRNGTDLLPAERNDRNEQIVDEWFNHLEYRQNAFREFYPFTLHRNILSRKKNLAAQEKLYIFLLLSSSLKYFTKEQEGYFTSRFEIVSLLALKNYLPQGGKAFLVGKNPLNQGRYAGTTWHKIKTLAQDIRESPPRCKEEDFDRRDTGDKGLDLVGWIRLGDTAQGFLVMFGQCGCGKGWDIKQLESHETTWRKYLNFTVAPNNLVFIPYCFRGADGNWYKYLDITASILVDRLRLIYLLRKKYHLLKNLHPYDFIDEILEYSEPLF